MWAWWFFYSPQRLLPWKGTEEALCLIRPVPPQVRVTQAQQHKHLFALELSVLILEIRVTNVIRSREENDPFYERDEWGTGQVRRENHLFARLPTEERMLAIGVFPLSY